MRPYDKTVTRRRKAANNARVALATYQRHAGGSMDTAPTQQAIRLTRLLWAQAFIAQTIALETRGALGDLNATPARILRAAGLTIEDLFPPTEGEG